MKKSLRVVILMVSIILFFMQSIVEAKYVFSYENTIAQVYIDNINPTIEGVEENGKYNKDITVKYYDNTEIERAIYYYNSEKEEFNVNPENFESGHVFSAEGYYRIIVTDIYNNETQIQTFLIDKTAPQIIGVEKGIIYDLPPNIEYYDKYGIEKVEITTEEELELEYQYKNSNLKPFSDRTRNTLSVNISYAPQNVEEYRWYMKKETELEYQLIDTNLENRFTFIGLESDTKYNIYCIAKTTDNKSYLSNFITAKTLDLIEQVEIINVTNTSYQVKVTGIDYEKYDYILFPTWSDIKGQDDIQWYKYEINSSEYIFTMNYENHNQDIGRYNTHIYLQEKGKDMIYAQSTYVHIGEEEPKKESTDFYGKVEITVIDNVGNQTNTDYYVDRTVTIPFQKTLYNKLKELISDKMQTYNDSTSTIEMKQSQIDSVTKLELTNCVYNEEGQAYLLGKGCLHYFRKLEHLDISGSSQFSVDDISTLKELRYLDISNCQSDYIYDLAFLNQLPKLEYLNTTGTNIINEEIINNLQNLKEWKN